MAVKKIPMRKCAGCDCMKEKKELIRIVHTPEDEFIVDFSGKKSGRGVYLCHSKACLETARFLVKRFHGSMAAVAIYCVECEIGIIFSIRNWIIT